MSPGVHIFHAGTKKLEDGSIVTDGGRVMAISAAGKTLKEAVDLAYQGADAVDFEGKTLRRDIAHLYVLSLDDNVILLQKLMVCCSIEHFDR